MAKKQTIEGLDSSDLFEQLLKDMRKIQSDSGIADSIRTYTHIIALIEAAYYFYQTTEFY